MNNINIRDSLTVRYIKLISLLTWISTPVAGSVLNNNLPSKYQKCRNTLVENSTAESHEKDIEEIPETDKIVFYTEENGKEIKHCIHRDDHRIYEDDLELLKGRFDERVEACKEWLYHVGTPELYKLWEPNGGECLDIPKWLIKKIPDNLQASCRDNNRSKGVEFLTWLKLAKEGKIDDLDYRHIDKSSINYNDYNNFVYDEAHKKIPSHYYLRQKHKYDIATGKACLKKITFFIPVLVTAAIEVSLLFISVGMNPDHEKPSTFELICFCLFFYTLLSNVYGCIQICIDPTGELARRKYRRKGLEKILFKEPSKWEKKYLCMKKKNFNDKKRHFIPNYTYFNLSSHHLSEIIASYFIKDIPLKPIESYVNEEKHTHSQELVVGENHQ